MEYVFQVPMRLSGLIIENTLVTPFGRGESASILEKYSYPRRYSTLLPMGVLEPALGTTVSMLEKRLRPRPRGSSAKRLDMDFEAVS